MRRRYTVTAILTTDARLDGTTTQEAKEVLELAVAVGTDEADLVIETFEVKAIGEDPSFVA